MRRKGLHKPNIFSLISTDKFGCRPPEKFLIVLCKARPIRTEPTSIQNLAIMPISDLIQYTKRKKLVLFAFFENIRPLCHLEEGN